MKKFVPILCVFVCLLMVSCTSDEPVPTTTQECISNVPINSIRISTTQAIKIANEAASVYTTENSRSARFVNESSDIVAITKNWGRSAATDTLIYIVNYTDNKGFAVISAINIEPRILAVIDKGTFDLNNPTNNPGFNLFINCAKDYIADLSLELRYDTTRVKDPTIIGGSNGDRIPNPGDPSLAGWRFVNDTLRNIRIEPRIDLEWGQESPAGDLCPNLIAGCAPLAMTMIMAYHKPTQLISYTYPNAYPTSEYVNWNEVNKHKYNYFKRNSFGSYDYTSFEHICTSDYATHDVIARVCRQVGQIANSDYSNPYSTSTFSSKYYSTLKHFLPNKNISTLNSYSISSASTYITKNNCILMMRGNRINDISSGHAWIADGYIDFCVRTTSWKQNPDTGEWEMYSNSSSGEPKMHYNWGWNGSENGYYSDKVLTNKNLSNSYTNIEYIAIY